MSRVKLEESPDEEVRQWQWEMNTLVTETMELVEEQPEVFEMLREREISKSRWGQKVLKQRAEDQKVQSLLESGRIELG